MWASGARKDGGVKKELGIYRCHLQTLDASCGRCASKGHEVLNMQEGNSPD